MRKRLGRVTEWGNESAEAGPAGTPVEVEEQ